MKKLYIVLLSVAMTATAHAQDNVRVDRRVELRNVVVGQRGDTVFLNFDVHADGRELSRKEGVVLIPRVKEAELPRIMVNGVRRARMYKREQVLARDKRGPKPGLLMTVRPGRQVAEHYRTSFVLPPQMAGSTLMLENYVTLCCSEMPHEVRNLTGPLLSQAVVTPAAGVKTMSSVEVSGMVSWLEPVEEEVKRRETSVTAFLTYPQGVTQILYDHGDNASELARIDRILSPLMDGGVYNIHSVRIDGYASIEGRWDTNERLARQRAGHFSQWLTGRYGGLGRVEVVARGEDWDGLVKMIRADINMPYGYEALAIIENYGIFGGREKHLMDLGQGVPYKYMYRYFFPKLRRMEVTFEYEVEALDGRRAEEVMESRPGDLSHAEMLRTLREQKMDALTMYRRVAAQYPDDTVALINVSSAEMVAGNLDQAWSYLQHIQDEPLAADNMKTYRLLTSDKVTAQKPTEAYRYKIATE